jgi:hypothetical protein
MLLVTGVVMTLVACGGQTPTATLSEPASYSVANRTTRTDFVDYEDAEYPFSLNLPRSWYMGQLDLDTYGIVVASTNEPSEPRSAISIFAEPMDVANGIDQTITGAEETLRNQAELSGWRVELARPVNVNALEGQERWYSYSLGQQKIRQRSFYVADGEQAYVVSLIAPQELYAEHDTLFSDVIASFRGTPSTASR